jgi:predicted RNase H-like nuclease
VIEVHPEVSFWAMNNGQRLLSKHTWTGFMMRQRLLAREGIRFKEEIGAEVGSADLLDAGAAAWTARRVAGGIASVLPARARRGEPTITF